MWNHEWLGPDIKSLAEKMVNRKVFEFPFAKEVEDIQDFIQISGRSNKKGETFDEAA